MAQSLPNVRDITSVRRSTTGKSTYEVELNGQWVNIKDKDAEKIPSHLMPTPTPQEAHPVTSQFAKGVYDTALLGTPMGSVGEMIKSSGERAGLEWPGRAVEKISEIGAATGYQTTPPVTATEHMGRWGGRVLGLLPAVTKGAVTAGTVAASPLIRATARTMTKPYVQSIPSAVRAIGTDLAAGAGAGAGVWAAKGTPWESTAETLGGFLGGTGPTALRIAASPGPWIARQLLKRVGLRGENLGRTTDAIRANPYSPMASGIEEIPIVGGTRRRIAGSSEWEADQALAQELGIPGKPFVPPGLTPRRAAVQVSSRVESTPDELARRLGRAPESIFTPPSVSSGERNLMTLDQRVAERIGPNASKEQVRQVQNQVRDLVRTGQDLSMGIQAPRRNIPPITIVDESTGMRSTRPRTPEESQTYIRTRPDVPAGPGGMGQTFIDDAISEASKNVGLDQSIMRRISSRSDVSAALADDLMSSRRALDASEDELWDLAKRNNRDATVDAISLSHDMRRWISSGGIPKAYRDIIPKYVTDLLPKIHGRDFASPGEMGLKERPRQILALYSRIREDARQTAGKGKGYLNGLANRILRQIDELPGYDEARRFTREKHEVWDREPVLYGVFRRRRGAAPGTPPEIETDPTAALDALNLFQSANPSRYANRLRSILDASSYTGPNRPSRDNTQMANALSDVLRIRFMDASNDFTNIKGARTFIDRYKDLWNTSRFPEFKTVGGQLKKSVELAEHENVLREMRPTVERILNAEQPLVMWRSEIKLSDRRPGYRRQLWKTALFDDIVRGQSGDTRGKILDNAGDRLVEYLDPSLSPQRAALLDEIYTKSEITRMRKIAEELQGGQRFLGTGDPGSPFGRVPGSDIKEDSVVGFFLNSGRRIGQFIGARTGGQAYGSGGAPALQGGAHGSKVVTGWYDTAVDREMFNLLEHSMLDKNLLNQLTQVKRRTGNWRSIIDLVKEKGGPLLAEYLEYAVVPTTTAIAKTKFPTEEEQQAAVQWFQKNPASFVPEITRSPGPSIGAPRR